MYWASGNGVSPSEARRSWIGQGVARLGLARHGMARVTDGGTEGFGLPCHSHTGGRGAAGPGAAKRGGAGQGRARRGKGCRRQHWGLRLPLLLSLEGRSGEARPGEVGYGLARRGTAWQGNANADDLSTGGLGLLCWVPWNPVMAWFGAPGRGTAWRGQARRGMG